MVVWNALNRHITVATLQESHLPRAMNLRQVTFARIRGEKGRHRFTAQSVGLLYLAAPPITSLHRSTRQTMVSPRLVVQMFPP